MATPIEIIDTRDLRGLPVSQRVHDVRDTAPGLTRALKEANIMKILGGSAPGYLDEANYNPDAVPPSLSDVMSYLGVKGTKDKSAQERFIEDFPKKLQDWKDRTLKDPKWGKSGWETIKHLYQQAVKDQSAEEAVKAREEAMRDAPLHFPVIGDVADPFPGATSKLTEILAPRSVAAAREGRTPEFSEWGRDVAANAAYAVPVSRIIGSATKAAPVVVRGISQGAGQFAAPIAVATMDNVVDDSRDARDWATDVAIGGMTNLGANKIIGPWIAGKLGALSGNISRRGGMGKIRDILEGSPSPEQKAADLVSGAKSILENEKQGLSAGLRSSVAPSTREAVSEAQKITDIAKVLEEPVRMPDGRRVYDANTGKPLTARDLLGTIEKQKGDEMLAREAEEVLGSVTQQVLNPRTATAPINETFREGAKGYAAVFAAHPELKSLFLDPAPFFSKEVTSNLPAMLQTYAVNQAGSSSDKAADIVGSTLGMGSAKEIREKNTERKAKATREAQIADILEGDAITEEDKKWLGAVRENPDMLKFSQDEGFKKWLLTRGADLLRNTALYRKAWDVE